MDRIKEELDRVKIDAQELIKYLNNEGEPIENEFINLYKNSPEFTKTVDNAVNGIESKKAYELCVCACCIYGKGKISKEEFCSIVDSAYDADDDWKNDYIEPDNK